MKRKFWSKTIIIGISLALLSFPVVARAQTEAPKAAPAPIAQQLVREGDLAVKLVTTLGLGSVDDETEAENQLAQIGIIPRNGWIADYPVTPDVFGELQKAVAVAATAGLAAPQAALGAIRRGPVAAVDVAR